MKVLLHTLTLEMEALVLTSSKQLDLDGTANHFADLPDNGDFNI